MAIVNRLYVAMGTGDTVLTMSSASGFPASPGVVQIGSEQIHYVVSTDTQLLNLTRAYNSTSAATHAANAIITFVSTDQPASAGGVWGQITGTLSDQTDLGTSLTAKAPKASPVFTTAVTLPASVVTSTQPTVIKPSADAVNAVNITESDGTTSVLSIDTTNRRVGVFTTTPTANGFTPSVEINGDLKVGNYIDVGGHNAACLINMVNPFAGLGIPAMTTAQKNAISPRRAGNMVFDTDLGKACVDNGTAWETITSA